MASRSEFQYHEKSVAQVLAEFRDELKDFASTRITMLRTEMREKLAAAAAALPAIAAGAILGALALLFLSVALVAVIAAVIGGGAGAWAAAFAIVGVLFLLTAAVSIWFAVNRLKASRLIPERTLRVLKQDQIWLQNEVQTRTRRHS
jgi:uncharacterized membrane protein YqjE